MKEIEFLVQAAAPERCMVAFTKAETISMHSTHGPLEIRASTTNKHSSPVLFGGGKDIGSRVEA